MTSHANLTVKIKDVKNDFTVMTFGLKVEYNV